MPHFILILYLLNIPPVVDDNSITRKNVTKLRNFIEFSKTHSPILSFKKWHEVKVLPSPYMEIATERVLSLDLPLKSKKIVLKSFPFCKEVLSKKKRSGKLALWLKKRIVLLHPKLILL